MCITTKFYNATNFGASLVTRHATTTNLNQYESTTHFNGQSTVEINGEQASGERYTIAHYLFTADGVRKIMIASLRYLDDFVKVEGGWHVKERNLILGWSETRLSTPQGCPRQSNGTPAEPSSAGEPRTDC